MPEVAICLLVNVFDPEKLLAYAAAHRDEWGFDVDWQPPLVEAVKECLVLHEPPGGPVDIGCEIIDSRFELYAAGTPSRLPALAPGQPQRLPIPRTTPYPEDAVQCDHCGGRGCRLCDDRGWHAGKWHELGRRCANVRCQKPLSPAHIAVYCTNACAADDSLGS